MTESYIRSTEVKKSIDEVETEQAKCSLELKNNVDWSWYSIDRKWKTLDWNSKSSGRQKEQVTRNLVKPWSKLKFGWPNFESFAPAHPNQNPTARIQSEQLDQKH